ncbi:hypothetical protein ISF_05721 [Cordyceps fumosorosea ARSEF 2679]|uniref:Uncharacterized protein n=1 Tax=Cordyceps fumosorosea (strain ARSEF 2679) TaxID=1081104 RepID=A0A167TK41_CORFA|nr:hypothetical protein ISF_05721 [Cordyceps fumosorosea ARSEF 2679]OAA60682.1 hypothetical protein ISF_05721 [Cordyceps fumosorosea ARSEF 2679]
MLASPQPQPKLYIRKRTAVLPEIWSFRERLHGPPQAHRVHHAMLVRHTLCQGRHRRPAKVQRHLLRTERKPAVMLDRKAVLGRHVLEVPPDDGRAVERRVHHRLDVATQQHLPVDQHRDARVRSDDGFGLLKVRVGEVGHAEDVG